MDYKSFLTRDYKNIARPIEPGRRARRLTGLHMVLILLTVVVVGTLFSFISLDASAKRHADTLNDDPLNKIIMPLDIPATLPLTSIVQTGAPDAEDAPAQWLSVKIKPGDSLAAIFKRHKLDASELHQIMQAGDTVKRLASIRPGQIIRLQLDAENSVQQMMYDLNRFETLAIHRDGDNFVASYHHRDVEKRINHASALITSSLFEAGRSAGLSDKLTMELAHIFGWDIDFALDIRQGDHFTVVYEEHFLNGSKVDDGAIVAAEFVNQGNAFKAILFTDESGRRDYYAPNGDSMRKAFLRTPVDFRRISSRFGNRKHPVLNRMRMHKGVDYSAPTGTPIKAAGDGKIVHQGIKGGYGKTVVIQHGGRYSTLYAHMSNYRRGIHVGKRVKQGQVIGYVGSTGMATGPHLHYEFQVNGVHRNPLTVKLPNAHPIDRQYKQAFDSHAQGMLSQLDMFKQTNLALNHQ